MERPSPLIIPLTRPHTTPPVVEQVSKQESSCSKTESFPSLRSLPSLPAVPSLTSSRSDALDTVPLTTSKPQEHVITAPIMGGVAIFAPEQEATLLSPLPTSPASPTAQGVGSEGEEEEEGTLLDKECFAMGSRDSTLYEMGWLDIACGPTITIDIEYSSHHHDPSPGDHTPLLPNTLRVDVDAPVALVRVFGCLARDLLGLKVSSSY